MVNSLSSPEQEKVTGLFNKFGVDYIATGDFAMRKYVDNKYFQNIQLWVKPTPDNFQKVSDAFASVRRKFDVDEKSFTTENSENALIKIGRGRKGVELYTGAPGMTADDFNKAFADRKVLNAGSVPIPILSEKDLHRTLEKSNQISQKADLQLLERAMPKLNSTTSKKAEVPVIDWKEAARTVDPNKLLTDLGFTHMPQKGFFATSKSQTYERGEERITVYPNKDNNSPVGKPFFIDQNSGKKGDAIDFLNWQHNYDRKEVNRTLKDHFGGLAPTPLSTIGSPTKKAPEQEAPKPDAKAVIEFQQKELKEKYGIKNSLERPEYLQSRGLSLNTIFRPEFFKQVLNSLGWSTKEQKTVNIDNTVFPMRNDQGLTSMIIRNISFKGFPGVERQDSVWLSNPPLSLNKDIKIGHGDRQIILPKGTEGTLIPAADKPGAYQFYYLDPHKAGRELNFNKLEVSGGKLEQLTKALNPLKVDRLVVTESPIDAMSLHQLAPPKPGETRMYLSTGGQPSEKQAAYINQLVQRIQPSQIVLGNDNEKAGTKFNINLMGAVQPPAGVGNQFLARLNEIKPQKDASGHTTPGEYQLKVFGAKDPEHMEKVAQRITDAINRFTPKGVEPPARITMLNGSANSGSEVTIAFPVNDRFLQIAQKELAKIINEQAPAKDMQLVKVVKPLNKDFNEDLKQSQEQKTKVNYDLDVVPKYIKNSASNLYHQITGYANNAFDALFGGVPGSLPKMESSHSRKDNVAPKKEDLQLPKDGPAMVDRTKSTQSQRQEESHSRGTGSEKVKSDLNLNEAKALSYASYQFLERNKDNNALSSSHKESVQSFKTGIDNVIKRVEAGTPEDKRFTVAVDSKQAKVAEKSIKEVVASSQAEGTIHTSPEKWSGVLKQAHASLSNAVDEGKKEAPKIQLEKEAPKVQAEAAATGLKKNDEVKLFVNSDIKPVAQVDLGFVRNEHKRDLVVIGKDNNGQFHEGVKVPGANDKVLWKSEMSPLVKDLLAKDKVIFMFEPKLDPLDKISYGKDLSGNYFHTKNDYAIDVGLKQQWTRLDPKEGKLMEFGESMQKIPVKAVAELPGKVNLELTANEAKAVSFALHHHLKKNEEPPGMSSPKSNRLWEFQEKFEDAIKKIDPATGGNTKVNVEFSSRNAKEIEKAVKEVIATANPKDVFLFKPNELVKDLRSGHESISQAINPAQKATVTLLDGAKKTPTAAETEVKQEQPAQKARIRL